MSQGTIKLVFMPGLDGRHFIRYLAELQIFLSLCIIKLEFYFEKAISRCRDNERKKTD